MADNAEQQGFKVGVKNDDLFKSAATYYAKFRRSCPPEVVSYLVGQFALNKTGRLLDVGCGTGQIFLPLANYFDEVIAIDADSAMVEYAIKAAANLGLPHIIVKKMRAEEIGENAGSFRMATFGSSFHWMDRLRIGNIVYELLEPAGHIVLLCPDEIYSGTTRWEVEIRNVIAEWLGPERRAGGGVYRQGTLHEKVLETTRFNDIRIANIPVHEERSIDQIIGYLFSTSYASPAVLGEKRDGFESAIRQRLSELAPAGRFKQTIQYTIISAQRPA